MKQAFGATARGLRTFMSDVAEGFFEVTHNGFALLGLAIVLAFWRWPRVRICASRAKSS